MIRDHDPRFADVKFAILTGVALCCTVVAAESRILHLPGGFTLPYGSFTIGGEFPGAKAELGFEQEGTRRFARLSFDLTKGNYVGYRVTEKIPAGTSRIAGSAASE